MVIEIELKGEENILTTCSFCKCVPINSSRETSDFNKDWLNPADEPEIFKKLFEKYPASHGLCYNCLKENY